MAYTLIQVPTVNDSPADFQKLFILWHKSTTSRGELVFDFSNCRFLRPNAIAFLGGLARIAESSSRPVIFKWDTILDAKVLYNLCNTDFAFQFGYVPSTVSNKNSIPYREDKLLDINGIMDYLTFSWIGKGWVHVSDKLRDAIAGKMWETYNNAFEHSGSPVGVFSCGQHFSRHNDLVLSIVDFGVGIPENVRRFLNQYADNSLVSQLTGAACLRWAFIRGNTTSNEDVARGLGLDLLREFVCVNQGKLEVYSNDGYAIIDKDGDRFENLPIKFSGTVVHITLKCDERLYRFTDEPDAFV